MRIGPMAWALPAAGTAARPEQGFRVAAKPASMPAASVSLPGGLLALGAAMPSARDALARRRGRALLGGLAELQRGLLDGRTAPATLERLAGLVEGEDGDDPAIADAMQALALRARIELLRHGLDQGRQAITPSR